MAGNDVSLRKRQQIANASRTMFIWVALASVVAGASGVAIYTLATKLLFNEKVLAEKSKTVRNLKQNISVVDELKNNIRVLNTNESLIKLKTEADAEPVQVVFDALPSSVNSTALGPSLQSDKLLGQEGIKIESLNVTPVAGVEDVGDEGSADAVDSSTSEDTDTSPSIEFTFAVSVNSADATKLKELMVRFERSIRSMNITSTRVENQVGKLLLTVTGRAYYEPAKSVSIQEKVVRP